MEAVGYKSITFTDTGEAVLFLNDGTALTVPAHVAEKILRVRAGEGLPQIPVTRAASGTCVADNGDINVPALAIPARDRQPKPLPPSVIPVPLVLWERDEESLTCARVIPYFDGFEIELRRRGPGPRSAPDFSTRQRSPNQHFHGLSVALRYADGREEQLDDLVRPDKEGSITITTFDRSGSYDDRMARTWYPIRQRVVRWCHHPSERGQVARQAVDPTYSRNENDSMFPVTNSQAGTCASALRHADAIRFRYCHFRDGTKDTELSQGSGEAWLITTQAKQQSHGADC